MGAAKTKNQARMRRKMRIRKKIDGTAERPRLSVYRSLKNISVQIIDDFTGSTLVSASSLEKIATQQPKFENKVEVAKYIGKLVGERAIKNGITKVVFDRNGFLYHGRVKAVSDGAREAGLVF
jgi:large subunit ribosomal protein L18